MTKKWAASAMIVSFALSVFSQQTTPPVKPTPTPPADADVVKISTTLIQLDVTVTDKRGDPVRDLTLDEIKVYENGKLQKITHLSFVPGAKPPPRTSEEKKAAAAAPVLPAGPVRPDQVRRTVAIVVDDGGFSWQSAFFARKELLKYIEEQVFDGDLVAIIRTSGGIGALQHFTTDKRVLRAAVENVRFYPGQPGGWDILGSSPTKEEDTMRAFRDEYYSFAGFSTLAYVIAGLNRMPGRKSIAFVSDGWMPPQRGQSTTQYERAQQNVVDFANRSSVVINTILASGVEFDGASAFDNIANPTVGGGGGWGSSSSSERLRPLRILGEDTGGRVIVNNNITNSIRRVFNDQSYYLVAYEPDEDTFDAKKRRFNKFEVKVSRPDVTVRHRNGFFGFTPELAAKVMPSQTSPLLAALMSPFAESGVFVRMNAVFTTDDTRKAYLKTFVNVNSSDLTFNKQPDGNYKTSFDIVALTVDLRGWLLDERPKNYTLTLGEKEYQRIRDRGLVMTFLVPMPGPGGFQVRIAVRDVASGDIGSASQFVEIPDLKNKRLAISGLVLSARNSSVPDPSVNGEASDDSDALRDTSLRQFKAGSILDVGYQIFNAKTNKDKTVDLSIKLKLYRDGKPISETDFVPVPDVNYEPGGVISGQAAITVGKALLPGDYLFQLEVKDILRKDKRGSVAQFVQFDVVE